MTTKAEQFLNDALKSVESESIRAWATSDHNRPLWIKYAAAVLAKNPNSEPIRFATYLTLTAMG